MNSTVVISGVTADNNFSGGIVADTFDTATSSFDIGNVVSINNNDGISLSSSSGNTRFDIHDNANISGNDFLPINILKAAFSTGGTLQGRIRNNTITVALGRPTDGIDVANRGGGTAAVAVTGNTINYGGTQLGINIAAGQDGAATHEVTVTGNTINITGTALQGILAQGILATPSGNGTSMCFDIGGAGALRNTINHVAGGTVNAGGDIRVRQRNGGPVRLPGYGGAAGDLAAVVAYLTGRNTLVSAPTATSDNSLYSGGGACVQPVFP
jgi:hypothetical protein